MIWDTGPSHISPIWTGFIPGAGLVWGGVGSGQDDQLCPHLSRGKSQVLLTLLARDGCREDRDVTCVEMCWTLMVLLVVLEWPAKHVAPRASWENACL